MTTTEYKSEFSINASQMRNLDSVDFMILKVFSPYRYGWDEIENKFRTFKFFPNRLTQDVVYHGNPDAKIIEGDTFSLREQYFDTNEKKFAFKKIKFTGEMYKLFRKVFDVDITPSKDVKLTVWDNTIKQNVDIEPGIGSTFTIKAVPASRVIGMIEALDLDKDVEMIDGKDKLGNPTKIRKYDWEDNKVSELSNKFIKMRVRGTGIDTKYTFVEGKEFVTESMQDVAEDLFA